MSSATVHFTRNGYDAICSKRTLINMTTNPKNVTCDKCIDRMAKVR